MQEDGKAPGFGVETSKTGLRFHNPLEEINVESMVVQINEEVQLSVTPQVVPENAGWVTVSWRNVDEPSSLDWIAVYVPADADPTLTAPIKFKMAVTDPGHLASGSGSVRFRLINMRADVRFAFFRGGLKAPHLAAWSQAVVFADPDRPMGVHLALTGTPGEMLVSWTTKERGEEPEVHWGQRPGQLTNRARAETTTHSLGDMCGGPAKSVGWIDPGHFHSALISGLLPEETVYYRVGEAGRNLSDEFRFVVAPQVGPTSDVCILAYGDMGQAEADGAKDPNDQEEPSLDTMARMLADPFVSGGSKWQGKQRGESGRPAQAPYMTLIGNHEVDWPASGSLFEGYDSGGECGVAYSRRLPMPAPRLDSSGFPPGQSALLLKSLWGGNAPGGSGRVGRIRAPWYSFDHGMVHLVMMSTEHDFRRGSEQYAFLAADLAGVNRLRTPWVVFNGHRPMYIDSINDDEPDGDLPVGRELKRWIEPLLREYKVELALWGHHHSYQRTCPVYQDRCIRANADDSFAATVHLVIGMGGAGTCLNIKPVAPGWTEYVNVEQHGYLRMTVNETRLLFEFIGNNEGSVLDSGVLTKAP
ncbi:purple acid phosphatases superfamily protein [Klebsormidium nitens]|uniref:Purple acid phosphatase n=1 Tax=Klebsormidium nitens TaxID=105231 RepID=A0A1Y1I9D1_KLENI|nr:purple acid phosphatases superfamily protein [Klebsormidium nitens]|eukprot:GAQ85317.1 purple acid phosphatases superfamily protein [Klebsormidium nitens]